MGVDVLAEVHVRRPPAAVAAYMTDPANDPRWIGGLQTARMLTPPPVAVGSRVERVATFLGRRFRYVNEVTALDDRHLEMRSVEAPFRMHITYGFAPDGDGTRVTNHVRGGGPRLIAPLVRRNVRRDLERLHAALEAS